MYQPWVSDGRAYQALVRFTGDGDRFAGSAAAALRASFPGAMVDAHTLRWPLEKWLDEVGRDRGARGGAGRSSRSPSR